MKTLIEFRIKSKIKALNHELVYGAPSPISIYLFMIRVLNDKFLEKYGELKYQNYLKNKFYYLIREAKLLKSGGSVPATYLKKSVERVNEGKTIIDTPTGFVDLSIILEIKNANKEALKKVIDEKEIINKVRFMGYRMKDFKVNFYSYEEEDNKQDVLLDYNNFLKNVFRKIKGRLIFKENFTGVEEFFEKLKNKENIIFPTTIGYRLFGGIKNLGLKKEHSFAEPLLGLVNVKSVFGLNNFEDKFFKLGEEKNLIFV